MEIQDKVFEYLNLDDCPANSKSHYQQRDLMMSISRDAALRGDGYIASIFTHYAAYSNAQGHAWRWHEISVANETVKLKAKELSIGYHKLADLIYERMAEEAKWA